MHIFNDFHEWREAITARCGLDLSHEYCSERIAALQDETVPSTLSFTKEYGDAYRQTVISWFEQARECK